MTAKCDGRLATGPTAGARSADTVSIELAVKRTRQRFDNDRTLSRRQHAGVDVERRFQPAKDLFPVARVQFNLVERGDLVWLIASHVTNRVDNELANKRGRHDRSDLSNGLQATAGCGVWETFARQAASRAIRRAILSALAWMVRVGFNPPG